MKVTSTPDGLEIVKGVRIYRTIVALIYPLPALMSSVVVGAMFSSVNIGILTFSIVTLVFLIIFLRFKAVKVIINNKTGLLCVTSGRRQAVAYRLEDIKSVSFKPVNTKTAKLETISKPILRKKLISRIVVLMFFSLIILFMFGAPFQLSSMYYGIAIVIIVLVLGIFSTTNYKEALLRDNYLPSLTKYSTKSPGELGEFDIYYEVWLNFTDGTKYALHELGALNTSIYVKEDMWAIAFNIGESLNIPLKCADANDSTDLN